MLPDGPSDRETNADRAAFSAMADGIKWEAECRELRAENARLTTENARLSKKIEEWNAYADAKRAGRPVDDVPFG
jgi:hypothetical protein